MKTKPNQNINHADKSIEEKSNWHLFLLSALYFSAVPQVLSKVIKPWDMPAFWDITPDKLILAWTVILWIVFLIIIPLLIAWVSTPSNLISLKKRTIKWYCIWMFIYWIIRVCGCLFFIFYLWIEIAWINQL